MSKKHCNPCYQPLAHCVPSHSEFSSSCCSNSCSQEGCRNDRIVSDAVIHCDSLVVRQDLCVSSLVGWSKEAGILQTETTIFDYPGDPVHPLLLLSVIARNISTNPVDVSIVNADDENDVLASATVAPNSEVALAAPNARQLIAAATAPSRVQFFITVFYPPIPLIPNDPI